MITRRKFIRNAAVGSATMVGLLDGDVTCSTSLRQGEHLSRSTYVVTEPCVGCKYTDCAAVCPVEAFHELSDRVYINPDTCINCDACVPECPVEAIYADTDVPAKYERWTQINIENAKKYPVISQSRAPLSTVGRCNSIEEVVGGTKLYSQDHLWVTATGRIGITDHIRQQLGDIERITFAKVGWQLKANSLFGGIEYTSRKKDSSRFKLRSPVSGEIIRVNTYVLSNPNKINGSVKGGWLIDIKLSDRNELKKLMPENEYQRFLEPMRKIG